MGTKVDPKIEKTVLDEGKPYFGEVEVLGVKLQTGYTPIYDAQKKIVGMFYVGVSKQFLTDLQWSFTIHIVIAALIILLLAGLVVWFIASPEGSGTGGAFAADRRYYPGD